MGGRSFSAPTVPPTIYRRISNERLPLNRKYVQKNTLISAKNHIIIIKRPLQTNLIKHYTSKITFFMLFVHLSNKQIFFCFLFYFLTNIYTYFIFESMFIYFFFFNFFICQSTVHNMSSSS